MQKNEQDQLGIGWVVGVKDASFYVDKISLSSKIETSCFLNIQFDNYTKFNGKLRNDNDLIGEIN